eukprot:1153141-Pelagomonas_calceolata.AAC.1
MQACSTLPPAQHTTASHESMQACSTLPPAQHTTASHESTQACSTLPPAHHTTASQESMQACNARTCLARSSRPGWGTWASSSTYSMPPCGTTNLQQQRQMVKGSAFFPFWGGGCRGPCIKQDIKQLPETDGPKEHLTIKQSVQGIEQLTRKDGCCPGQASKLTDAHGSEIDLGIHHIPYISNVSMLYM